MKIFNMIMAAVLCVGAQLAVSAPLKVKVTSGNFSPTPIAVMPFYDRVDSEDSKYTAGEMRKVIMNNLLNSGLFENVSQDAFLETVEQAIDVPSFRKWAAIRTDVLVTTELSEKQESFVFRVSLWDINRASSLFVKNYTIKNLKSARRLAHMITDDIYSRVTGEAPYFDSEIIYVAETKDSDGNTVKRLAIMDQDGYNVRYVTDGKNTVVTPRFSPNGKYLAFLSYVVNENAIQTQDGVITKKVPIAGIYFRNRETGKQQFLSTAKNTTYAPRFSPDSTKMIFSYMVGDNSDIWEMSILRGGKLGFVRLTDDAYIDTTPFYSPDGKNIVFVSDRIGSPQLYTMKADGSDQKRISYGDGAYTTPVWSPRGDSIAFTKQQGEEFCIGVMNTDGSGERLLDCSYLSEGPTFSPNGRVIMFFRQDKLENEDDPEKVYLMSVDITGRNLRRIATDTNASDPNWSVVKPR